MLEALVFALLSAASIDAAPAIAALAQTSSWPTAPVYQPAERSVDNWRLESAINLNLSPVVALSLALGNDLSLTPRCVKLNNYWCVKRAGWSGEIASDADGHVAFASAREGAAVAAALLRRYYVELGRRSARAIVSRWAPAQCALVTTVGHRSPPAAAPGASVPRDSLPRITPRRIAPMSLAPHGIQHTLRARWLASHARGGVAVAPRTKLPRKRASTASAKARVSDLMRAPSIAVGMGETAGAAIELKPAEALASPPLKPLTLSNPEKFDFSPTAPVFNCAAETARIANYAARVAEGVVKNPDEDLSLFAADGSPTENLVKVMANMAAVEIGPLRASDALIRLTVAQLQASLKSDAASR